MSGGHGRARKGQEEPSSIPVDIRFLFQAGDIPKVFAWCEHRYHLHPDWQKQFVDDLKKTPKDLPEQEFFFRWATEHLNYALQTILRRRVNVIEDIARYILKDRIAEKMREDTERRNRYRGEYKKHTI